VGFEDETPVELESATLSVLHRLSSPDATKRPSASSGQEEVYERFPVGATKHALIVRMVVATGLSCQTASILLLRDFHFTQRSRTPRNIIEKSQGYSDPPQSSDLR